MADPVTARVRRAGAIHALHDPSGNQTWCGYTATVDVRAGRPPTCATCRSRLGMPEQIETPPAANQTARHRPGVHLSVYLTGREADAVLRAHGLDHGHGVRKSAASQSATRKLRAAIEAARTGPSRPIPQTTRPQEDR